MSTVAALQRPQSRWFRSSRSTGAKRSGIRRRFSIARRPATDGRPCHASVPFNRDRVHVTAHMSAERIGRVADCVVVRTVRGSRRHEVIHPHRRHRALSPQRATAGRAGHPWTGHRHQRPPPQRPTHRRDPAVRSRRPCAVVMEMLGHSDHPHARHLQPRRLPSCTRKLPTGWAGPLAQLEDPSYNCCQNCCHLIMEAATRLSIMPLTCGDLVGRVGLEPTTQGL